MKLTPDEMSMLINTSVTTARLKSLETPRDFIRPQMHLILEGEIGVGKSTVLRKVCDEHNMIMHSGFSAATLMGTIDNTTKQFIPPTTWLARNSILPVDEFYASNSQKKHLNALLTCLEDQQYQRSVGNWAPDMEERDGDLYLKIEDSKIKVKTRFVFMATTMMNLDRTQMRELKALASRCVRIPFYPSRNELKEMARGKKVYYYEPYDLESDEAVVPKEDYEKILELVESYELQNHLYFRTISDCCRIYAVHGFDEEKFKVLIKLRVNQ